MNMMSLNLRSVFVVVAAISLGGCTLLGSGGPSSASVRAAGRSGSTASADIRIVQVDDSVARRVIASSQSALLSAALGDGVPFGALIGKGDVLDISIWEAPPAGLFGASSSDLRLSSSASARGTTLPEQMVDPSGAISMPFVGQVVVAGRTPVQVEREIVGRLKGMAHQPQVIVRVVRNATANVTVVGDVASSTRVALTPKGERLLDVVASAGGVRQPVGKTTIRVSREGKAVSLPLEQIISDPRQNIRMQADDVVTALFQPFSFTSLGAVGNNAEVPFEATGLSLAQALGRIGGLRDDRANIRGVFIFRLEDPAALDPAQIQGAQRTPEGRIPVIYSVDLKNPATFFTAQDFPIRNHDVVYVSNAPGADLQKFVNIVSSMVFSVIGISNSL